MRRAAAGRAFAVAPFFLAVPAVAATFFFTAAFFAAVFLVPAFFVVAFLAEAFFFAGFASVLMTALSAIQHAQTCRRSSASS